MEREITKGFYTALGTPVDESGNFLAESFKKQVSDQVEAGVSGLLVLGSMGIEPYIKDSEYVKIAEAAVEAAKGACPIFVGVMDNSVSRVLDRVKCLGGLGIDGVVATTPFYFVATQEELKNYFTAIAGASTFPLYLYDLPGVTKIKINTDTVESFMSVRNIKGIKTGDIFTARRLLRSSKKREDFSIFFSGLDVFDAAYKFGLDMNLDGMFSCTAPLASRMYAGLDKDDYEDASKCLDEIINLRDIFIKTGVMRGFTYAMNLLGYPGIYSPDYSIRGVLCQYEEIREYMKKLNLI